MNPMLEAVLQATLISKCVLVLLLFMSVASWAYMRQVDDVAVSPAPHPKARFQALDDAGGLNHALPVMEADRQSPPLRHHTPRRARIQPPHPHWRHRAPAQRQRAPRSALRHCRGSRAAQVLTGPAGHGRQHGPVHRPVRHSLGNHAFLTAIAQMKSVSLATVAPGIAEALIATAVGLLFVSYPPCAATTCSRQSSSI